MKLSLTPLFCVAAIFVTHYNASAQASFTAPDNVYVNTPVTVTNTSAGAVSYYWNFCSGSLYNAPQITNLGNPAGQLDVPVFLTSAKDGADYYAFVANHNGTLLRYAFGSNMLNTPVVTNFGNPGGVIPNFTEGLEVVNDATGWHVIIVGGDPYTPSIARLDFGASLANAPTGVNWGNIGNMSTPHDFFLAKENNNWFGFTVNAGNNTITRFDFGTSFSNPPTGVNLGNVGSMSQPTGVYAIQENGNWHVFVTNASPGSLSRLDFGNSLTNTPTGVNLGDLAFLQAPRDISLINDCGKTFGLVMDAGRREIVRVEFSGGLSGTLTPSSIGIGGFNFLHSIANVFREGNNLYAFVLDAWNSTLHRLVYNSCTNSSIPSSNQQQPPAFSYNMPGTYTINLVTNEGLPNQSAFCKTIEVLAAPPPTSVASFTAPDTVCVNAPVNITNTSQNATSYYWNFCSGGVYNAPQVTNLGNIQGMDAPVFIASAKDGNDYYAFFTNNNTPSPNLYRLYFGTSLLNTPVVTNLGDFGGAIPINTEGVQVVNDADGWHVLVVGAPLPGSSIAKVDFGASLANNSPVAVNWGNLGNMSYPHDLYITQENNNWIGFTVNAFNNTITRFDFGTSFQNPPVATNLGNLGNLSYPDGIFPIQENGNWHVFVTNRNTNAISRLDFGSSLLNVPTGTDLGNPGGQLAHPRDLTILHDCGRLSGLVVNEITSDIVRLDFNSGLTGAVSGVSLGVAGAGGLDFPHSISTMFREGNTLYAFIVNAHNNTLARIAYNSCTNSSIPSSNLQQPPSISYNAPGTYTINLVTDEGLPSQNTFCKTVVVLAPPVVDLGNDTILCHGGTLVLDAGPGPGSYLWSNGAATRQITVNQSGAYSVEVDNGGCTAQDNIEVTISPLMQLSAVTTQINCIQPTGSITLTASGGTLPYRYYLDATGPVSNNVFNNLPARTYTARVEDQNGCTVSQPVTVQVDPNGIIDMAATGTAPTCNGMSDGAISALVLQGVPPFEYAVNSQPFQSSASFSNLSAGNYMVYARNSMCIDSQQVTLTAPVSLVMQITATDELCNRSNGSITLAASGGSLPYDIYWDNVLTNAVSRNNLSAGTYALRVDDANGCSTDTLVSISNIITPRVEILNNDTTINIGETIRLVAVNAPDYIWTPSAGLSCADCATPIAQPMQPTRYIVNTVTGLNCVPADTVNIYLSYNRSLFVPTAFSPNADGNNDLFRVKAKGVAVSNLQVYNRWGQLIFEANDVSRGWDGRFKGELQPAGTYVYVVNYAYYGREAEMLQQKGTFTLVR
jgi:gliding motility-associated-like protein